VQALRKAVFYILVLVYLAVCPYVILYSFGFILNPKDKNIVQTGLVEIKSIPEDATVYLDDVPWADKTPLIMRRVLPGKHAVKVSLEGHVPWRREISVSTGKPVVYENLLLFPQTWEPKEISSQRFSTIVPVPGTNIIVLGQEDSAGKLFIFEGNNNYMQPLVHIAEETKNRSVVNVFTIEGSDVVIVETLVAGRKGYLWIEIGEKKSQAREISHLFLEQPRTIVWDPETPYRLFSWQAGHLNLVDVDQDSTKLKVLKDIKGFGLYHTQIYYLDEEGRFLRTDVEGTDEEVLLAHRELRTILFKNRTDVRIIWLDKKTVIFIDSNGSLIANHLPYNFVNQGVIGWQFDRQVRRLLVWTMKRIGILDFSEASMEDDSVFDRGPGVNWIYDKGQDIRTCYWVNRGSHVLFRDKGYAYLLELDPYSEPVLYFVTRMDEESGMSYMEETGNMYFLGESDGKLMVQNLVPIEHRSSLIRTRNEAASGGK
jgi:hypothetical protein